MGKRQLHNKTSQTRAKRPPPDSDHRASTNTRIFFSISDKVLSINHVRNFEPVYYDHEEVHRQHHMAKRSTAGRVQLDFKAFDM